MYLHMTFRKLPFIATANSFYDYDVDNSAGYFAKILKTFRVKVVNLWSSEFNNVGTNIPLPLYVLNNTSLKLRGFEAYATPSSVLPLEYTVHCCYFKECHPRCVGKLDR